MTLFEDSDSNIHLKNLSMHQASNEEEGKKTLKWLVQINISLDLYMFGTFSTSDEAIND